MKSNEELQKMKTMKFFEVKRKKSIEKSTGEVSEIINEVQNEEMKLFF